MLALLSVTVSLAKSVGKTRYKSKAKTVISFVESFSGVLSRATVICTKEFKVILQGVNCGYYDIGRVNRRAGLAAVDCFDI